MSYEKLKAVIQQAVPSIMDLKFGCEVEHFLKGTAVILKVHQYEGESDCYDVAYYRLPEMIVERTPFNNWKILGRPIRLSDVLVAIYKMRNSKESVFVRQDGVIFRWEKFTEGGDGHHGVVSTYVEWNLLDDDLNHQSEETLKFLTELLCK